MQLSIPNIFTLHVTHVPSAPRPSHQTDDRELQPALRAKEEVEIWDGLSGAGQVLQLLCHPLSLTALAVESFPAMTFTPVASRPEDAHALVHARVGFAQVHRAFCFCNKHRQNSGVRHTEGVLTVKCTSISNASENSDSN